MLDVVVVFQGLDQFHQCGDRIARHGGEDPGPPDDVGGAGRTQRGFQRRRHVGQQFKRGKDRVTVLVGLDIVGAWLKAPCEITSGKDGELGALRKIAGRVEEVIVAVTPMSYTYADINPAILYHGTVEIRPVDKKTSKLVYSLFFDEASIPAEQRAANKERRQKMFAGIMATMKTIAETK